MNNLRSPLCALKADLGLFLSVGLPVASRICEGIGHVIHAENAGNTTNPPTTMYKRV